MFLDSMSYREQLPDDCPPSEAEEILAARIVFRLVSTNPVTLNDFRSQRALRPEAKFDVSECQARGLSVFADRADIEKTRRLPKFRSWSICQVQLEAGAGYIQQTGGWSHHTWWPFAEFDILTHCENEVI